MTYIPTRMCIVCRKKGPKDNFIRIRLNDTKLQIDDGNNGEGRSLYICKGDICVRKAIDKRIIEKKLKKTIDNSIYAELEGLCKNE